MCGVVVVVVVAVIVIGCQHLLSIGLPIVYLSLSSSPHYRLPPYEAFPIGVGFKVSHDVCMMLFCICSSLSLLRVVINQGRQMSLRIHHH